MSLSHSQIENAAPDQSSLNAARKLLKANKWPVLCVDEEVGAIFGDCQGSGAAPYRVAVDLSDLVGKCSCPSRKFPCKHALALMWWYADEQSRFSTARAPDWVHEWLSRRRQRGAPAEAKARGGKGSGERPTLAEAAQSDVEELKQSAQSAKARERNRVKREASIEAGLGELDRWIGDIVQQGLAAFAATAAQQCALLARRLVDAKAGGIAKRLEAFPTQYFETPEPERADLLIEFLGQLHLLASAYRRQEELPAPLRADVRRLVGWAQSREELLQASGTLRVEGRWFVLAVRRQSQPDRLMRVETWLLALESTHANADAPQVALLLDFVPVAMASKAAPPYQRGQVLDATLAFYLSATPLVALVAEHRELFDGGVLPVPASDLHGAIDVYRERLARNPWLHYWPVAFDGVALHVDGPGTYWFSSGGEKALRVHPEVREGVSTLVGLESVGVYGLHDGRYLWPLAATTPLGPWWGEVSG